VTADGKQKNYGASGSKDSRNLDLGKINIYPVSILTSNLAKSLRKPEIKKFSHVPHNKEMTITQILTLPLY
jgi:hypothetical protein